MGASDRPTSMIINDVFLLLLLLFLCLFFHLNIFSIFFLIAHMWFDNKIFEADTTEDQSGTPMEKVLKYLQLFTSQVSSYF